MKPLPGTYPHYYHNYISNVNEDTLIEALWNNLEQTKECFSAVPVAKENYYYANGKWTIKELLNHIIDSERIFAYRALCFARDEKKILPTFGEEEYAAASAPEVKARTIISLIEEFECVRKASLCMFSGFSQLSLLKKGLTPLGAASVVSIGFIICGHASHHLHIVKEKYL